MIFSKNKELIIKECMYRNIPEVKKDINLRLKVYTYTQDLLLQILKDINKDFEKNKVYDEQD
jgi:hypothetical protein